MITGQTEENETKKEKEGKRRVHETGVKVLILSSLRCISNQSWRGNGLFIQLTRSQDVELPSNRWVSIVSLQAHIDKKNPSYLNYLLQTQTAGFNTVQKIKQYICTASDAKHEEHSAYYIKVSL